MTLKVEWGLNEGAGTSGADSSGAGHVATVSGWTTGHTSGGATDAKFVGSLLSSPTGFTVMGWAKPVSSNSGDTVLALADGEPANSWWFEVDWADSTHLQIDVQAPGHGQQQSAASVTSAVGTWVHVAMSWSASTGTVTLYLNGVSRATLTASGAFTSAGFLTAGSWDFYGNNNVTVVDDVRLDDTALSSAAITNYMNTPAGATAVAGSASLSGSGALSVSGKPAVARTAALSGSGTLSAAGVPRTSGAVSLSGAGTLTASGVAALEDAAALSGTGSLTGDGTAPASGDATLSGSGLLSTTATVAFAGTVSFTGSGSLTVKGAPAFADAVGLSGEGTLSGVAQSGNAGTAIFGGEGQLGSTGALAAVGTCVFVSTGTLTVAGAPAYSGTAAFNGSGALTYADHGQRDITVTGSLGSHRWAGSVGAPRYVGVVGLRRWAGSSG